MSAPFRLDNPQAQGQQFTVEVFSAKQIVWVTNTSYSESWKNMFL